MEKEINLNLTKLLVIVSPVDYGIVKAFAEVHFLDAQGIPVFKLRGFTVKLKDFKGTSALSVDFPAYPSKGFYKKVLYIENHDLWKLVADSILETLAQLTGNLTADEYKKLDTTEEINPDDIPF